MPSVKIKRIYAPVEESDGFRILVDRLWPRGIKKESSNVDVWLKEVAPSAELRKWFCHDPEKWETFIKEYKSELKQSPALKELIEFLKQHKTVTLLYGSKDEEHNQAVVLKVFLEKKTID
jgi:uncharacterized protein YeaO (DUF488 family)